MSLLGSKRGDLVTYPYRVPGQDMSKTTSGNGSFILSFYWSNNRQKVVKMCHFNGNPQFSDTKISTFRGPKWGQIWTLSSQKLPTGPLRTDLEVLQNEAPNRLENDPQNGHFLTPKIVKYAKIDVFGGPKWYISLSYVLGFWTLLSSKGTSENDLFLTPILRPSEHFPGKGPRPWGLGSDLGSPGPLKKSLQKRCHFSAIKCVKKRSKTTLKWHF